MSGVIRIMFKLKINDKTMKIQETISWLTCSTVIANCQFIIFIETFVKSNTKVEKP